MMAITVLDIETPTVNDDNKPTLYFEDQWFQLVRQLEDMQNKIDDLQAQIDSFHP